MVKIDPPEDDVRELRKNRSSRSLVKRVIDSQARDELDSETEDQILDEWVEQTNPTRTEPFDAGPGCYPAESRLDEQVVVSKEVNICGYRPDSIIRWPNQQPDGFWSVVEVKRAEELGPAVLGHLLVKSSLFQREFSVRAEQVEQVLLADNIPTEFRDTVEHIESQHGVNIRVAEADLD